MDRTIVSSARLSLVALIALCLTGCSVKIPPKTEVRDIPSGTTYTTYESWGKVQKGVGYAFTDIDTGRRVTLTNYELRPLESAKEVSDKSPEAKAYKEAKARAAATK